MQLPISNYSLFYLLTLYSTNSTIRGVVQFDGLQPGYPVQLFASSPDTAEAKVYTDAAGNFTIPVSDKIATYQLFAAQLPFGFTNPNVQAKAGDSDVVVNVYSSDVGRNTTRLPKTFSLSQNYPNPFNSVTVIRYQLPVNSHVVLRIYNMLGQEIKTLIDGIRDAGYESVNFDASTLASGIYFYKVEAASTANAKQVFTQVKKMVVIR